MKRKMWGIEFKDISENYCVIANTIREALNKGATLKKRDIILVARR